MKYSDTEELRNMKLSEDVSPVRPKDRRFALDVMTKYYFCLADGNGNPCSQSRMQRRVQDNSTVVFGVSPQLQDKVNKTQQHGTKSRHNAALGDVT
jgi:hypothetical protein